MENSNNYNKTNSIKDTEDLDKIKTLYTKYKESNRAILSQGDSKFKPLYDEIQRLYDYSLKFYRLSKKTTSILLINTDSIKITSQTFFSKYKNNFNTLNLENHILNSTAQINLHKHYELLSVLAYELAITKYKYLSKIKNGFKSK